MGEMAVRLDQLNGTRAQGTVQIAEVALNEALRAGSGGATAPVIRLFGENLIEVRYGMLHARAVLPPIIDVGPPPRVTVVLASKVVAWGLRAAVRQPFIAFNGRHVTIHLAAVPALAGLRDLWPHVTAAGLSTAPGVLRLHVDVSVNHGVQYG